ncbi:uncharacterized protein ASCRUDRAFT_69873 [Ascoidea rubescens DSM 1968]|uniref:Amino acid permease/ SLC12A domain-containing protein n=1 Tax=Ascoidea rubescens DSM 1968 TaxID=1344418 RepID=A0A1D2VI94_9ASCO|nr:hypothetical protein ASCRUDRAFT_69873 [Ascoidea rubescens DSM 1968]ODV61368.1 hypothetical protein ASCRUDRAFT_69873 [Ascoidea rubescens DSM 1968]
MSSKLQSFGRYLKDNFTIEKETPYNSSSTQSGPVEGDNFQLETKKDEKIIHYNDEVSSVASRVQISSKTHRRLENRHIQLIGIGGTIGTALFVSLGRGLYTGGPLSLFLAMTIWCVPICLITVSTAEMVCYLPISSPFIRLSGRCVDEAFEFMAGWNFWFLEGSLIPFEVTAVNTIIHYWRDDYSAAIPLAIQMVLYFLINTFAVRYYGESEFWFAIGKVILILLLICFTFVTMCGGNPAGDAYGFRYWTDPAIMNEYYKTGDLGRFLGYLSCAIRSCFVIAGPEYVSMAAGETINPRVTLKKAFKQVFVRLTFFFVMGAFCISTVVSSRDPTLVGAITESIPGAGSSPYVVAMQNMKIKVLPDIVNIGLLLSAFSAGNSYSYCSSRSLYGMALDGKAPKFLSYCTKTGVPIFCVAVSLCWALLSFLQLGENSATVLDWIVNLVTASQLINFCVLCVTYIFFHKAVIAQGIDRNTFAFKGWYQPYLAYIGLAAAFLMVFVSGYTVFLPSWWSVKDFLFSYIMVFLDISLFIGYKIIKKTKIRNPLEVDLITGLDEVEEHERDYYEKLELNKDNPKKWYNYLSKYLFGE